MLFHRKKTFGEQEVKVKNKGAAKELMAKLSRGLMLPIAMLPIAGLFLGIGSAIVSNTSAYG
jgi:PTS system glucose-specific IIC component